MYRMRPIEPAYFGGCSSPFNQPVTFSVLMGSGCSSNSNTEVQLPNGIHCRSESHGSFLWKTTSTACVDANGKVIGSYSNY